MEGSSAYVESQVSKSGKRKWTMTEDIALISCMIDLWNMDTHNADAGFKSGYLLELEKMLLEKLPNCRIKAKPHIESRLKTLKKEWAIVYDMILNTLGFGWDSTRKMAMNTMAADMKEACMMLSKSIHSDIVQEKFLELPGTLRSVDGLTSTQVRMAIQKFGNHPNYIMLFFGIDPEDRLEMV
ncbi:hypothetical protein CDL15_Pgr015066 [Punica granatum]|uniref:Myb/SANT-like domain-containing protein n=1 Tax=Punica granatum TaxID=22663 RepID=A0A218WZS8_PUNGR|nr:hypothetical protein CDL15_Pgr015066 [Punica granatum]